MATESDRQFYNEPDRLAEGFLNEHFIWQPDDIPQGRLGLDKAEYALRNWRDEFYRYEAGRYVKVSESELKRLVTKHLHSLNSCLWSSRRR